MENPVENACSGVSGPWVRGRGDSFPRAGSSFVENTRCLLLPLSHRRFFVLPQAPSISKGLAIRATLSTILQKTTLLHVLWLVSHQTRHREDWLYGKKLGANAGAWSILYKLLSFTPIWIINLLSGRDSTTLRKCVYLLPTSRSSHEHGLSRKSWLHI